MAKGGKPRPAWRSWLNVAVGVSTVAATVVAICRECVPRPPEEYRISVSVLDPDNRIAEDARVSSSPGGVVKKAQGGWEIEIPARSRPADGRVRIDADWPDAFLTGSTTVTLDSTATTATIRLTRKEVDIAGAVQDENGRPLPGTSVAVIGHEEERALTDRAGSFRLRAHAAHLQPVRLRAWRDGYEPRDEWHPAGGLPVVIVLSRLP